MLPGLGATWGKGSCEGQAAAWGHVRGTLCHLARGRVADTNTVTMSVAVTVAVTVPVQFR